MKAFIADAGYGRRLYPITKCISKGLLPVYNKPALMFQLDFLADMGIKEAAVVVSEANYNIYKNFLNEIDTKGIEISLFVQKSGEGIIAAYESCTEFTKGNDIIAIMGDCLYFVNDVKKLLKQAENCFNEDKVGVVIGKSKPGSNNEFLNKISDFHGLCETTDPDKVKDLGCVGMFFLPKTISGSMNSVVKVELKDTDMDSVYTKLLQTGRIMLPQMDSQDEWFDIGTPERLFSASAYVRGCKFVIPGKNGVLS